MNEELEIVNVIPDDESYSSIESSHANLLDDRDDFYCFQENKNFIENNAGEFANFTPAQVKEQARKDAKEAMANCR